MIIKQLQNFAIVTTNLKGCRQKHALNVVFKNWSNLDQQGKINY